MLGHFLFREFSRSEDIDIYATTRAGNELPRWFAPELLKKIIFNVDADRLETVISAFESVQPELVINCIGLIKQQSMANDSLSAITVNSLLPHRLAHICGNAGSRLIHISTDCVFNGKKGMYKESDESDAGDLCGRTKYLGELTYQHCVTLRTSIIGHELKGRYGLIEWFLAQKEKIRGFRKAIYSGFPTVEFARIIRDYVLPNPELSGIYHVSSDPISKYDLLRLVARKYDKRIEIAPDDSFIVDRSLDSSAFRKATGYQPPAWDDLIEIMHSHFTANLSIYKTGI